MSATILRKKRQITLPDEVCNAAGVRVNDQVEWRFEAGEIRGRKLHAIPTHKVIIHQPNLVMRDGHLVFDAPEVPPEAIAQAVREEREDQEKE